MNKINEIHFDQFPVLETDRMILRQFSLDDAKDVFAMRSDHKMMKFMDSKHHESIEESRKFVQSNMDIYAGRKGIFWAIINKKTNRFMGDFAFWRIDNRHARAEIGYALLPSYWGEGYMFEAMNAALEFAFSELGVHSVEANINTNNIASRKFLKKMGFQKEAYFRENYYYEGKFLDSEIYCLLESDMT